MFRNPTFKRVAGFDKKPAIWIVTFVGVGLLLFLEVVSFVSFWLAPTAIVSPATILTIVGSSLNPILPLVIAPITVVIQYKYQLIGAAAQGSTASTNPKQVLTGYFWGIVYRLRFLLMLALVFAIHGFSMSYITVMTVSSERFADTLQRTIWAVTVFADVGTNILGSILWIALSIVVGSLWSKNTKRLTVSILGAFGSSVVLLLLQIGLRIGTRSLVNLVIDYAPDELLRGRLINMAQDIALAVLPLLLILAIFTILTKRLQRRGEQV